MDILSMNKASKVSKNLDLHEGLKINESETHGIRVTDGKFEYFDGSQWKEVKSGSQIKLGNVSGFTVAPHGYNAILKWNDPSDLVVNGVSIARWKGTKILRKTTGFPQNENDGVLVINNGVRDQYSVDGFADTGLIDGQTYYYMAFPYTEEDAYTVDEANGVEYIHNIYKLSGIVDLEVKYLNGEATIFWSDPDDLIINEKTVARWKGTKILRKTTGFPQNENDGVLVVSSEVKNQYYLNGFADTGLIGEQIYYYMAFPYTEHDVYTNSEQSRFEYIHSAPKIYGVSIDLTNSNPSTAVTYIDSAVGMVAGSSDWDNTGLFKNIKPCILKDGVVQYYLNPNDFTKKIDGTIADITSGNDGDVMIEIPKIGYKIETIDSNLIVKLTEDTEGEAKGFKYHAHTRTESGDRDKLYIGAYLGFNLSSKLRSLSGKTPYAGGTAPAGTIGTCRTLAQANGSGYDLVSFYPLTLLQCLYIIKYKNLDSQTALGRGYVDGNTAAIKTGGTNAKGMFFGETTGKQQMKFLGIEDMWGNLRWWIDGLFSDASRNILTAFDNFNDTGSGYTSRGQGATTDIGNYMSKPQGSSETGFIAKEVSASATTHFTDDAALNASRLPNFGGSWRNADNAGVFYLYVNYSDSYSYATLGGRLMYL